MDWFKKKDESIDELNTEELSNDIFEDEAIDTDEVTPAIESEYSTDELNCKLKKYFEGKIVRKDLTKKIKEGANVPVYVLEYLLGMYCSSDDEAVVEDGVATIKKILSENYVRPDEAQKFISKLRERGTHTVIDKISVRLDSKNDRYICEFSNLGLSQIPISETYPEQFERLLCGGIWCIVNLEYFYDENDKQRCPFIIKKITPVQMPSLDLNEIKVARKEFTKDEWIDVMLRSVGMEPSRFTERVKWLLLARMMPLIENNVNLCELGPRGTGKSHIYKEISPNSILVSGGQTTVANLFYSMSTKQVGLVGMWDCVAFDEVAGIKFKDQDGIQIMKDYMASGSFSRGKEEKAALASMVFVGNINQSVDALLKTSHLFEPFPVAMNNDSAFFDRMHCYIPGWEIPKYRPNFFTDEYGLISDYLSEAFRELRKISYADAFDKYFKLGDNLNQRDVIAVRKMMSSLVKLIYPDGEFTKDNIEEILRFALEQRRRVKEQLKRIGGMEFYDVNFSYIDNETFEEKYVSVPEQGGGKLIPEGICKPGQVYTIGKNKTGMIGTYRLEAQVTNGGGKFVCTGIGTMREAKENVDTAFRYLKANSKTISGTISVATKDFMLDVRDLNGVGMTGSLSLATFISLCSAALNKSLISSVAILGNLSIGGSLEKIDNLANTLQVCLDSGAKKILIPIAAATDMASVPAELMSKFNLIFYSTPEDAVFKALGVE